MDFSADMADAAAFEAMCRADVEHTAKVVRRNGLSTLLVDGESTPPILFKGHSAGGKANVFSGKALADAGVHLMVANVGFRGSPWFPKSPWTRDGFDAESAVKTIRKAMLTATNALWLVTLRVDPPMDYVYWHPEEAWRSKDGGYVFGNGVHVQGTHQTLDPINTNSPPAKWEWAWTSMCSRHWREEVKANISAVISRLKETGLSKRIVGIHLGGFHDAQFATAAPDFSPSAKAAFAESGETDYDRFLKRWPQRLIDELARHVKGCFGKDIVVLRWCMASFGSSWCSSHDIWEFLNSEHVDGLVPQAGYSERRPGEPLGVKLPHSSFHGHGKLLVCEHDLYPWIIRDPYRPPYHDRMVGRAKNPDDWAMVNRKTAGAMVARNMGWWYFDMGGGWYSPDEIKNEIASTVHDVRSTNRDRMAAWRPSAALVIDSEDLLSLQHADGCEKPACSLDAFVREIARSGVPFDSYLKKDLDAHPAIARAYKAIIPFDSKTKIMGTAEIQRRVREAGGYVPVPECTVSVDMNGGFLSVHGLWDRKIDFELPFPCRVINLKSGMEEHVSGDKFQIEVKQGETCWFRLEALAAGLPLAAAAVDCRPETWFHIIGGNASKAGLTADLEALKGAGFGGIQFFHGQFGESAAWDGVAEQIPCLSPKWDELVAHAADECARLGLSFKMQNCPGWSMSGGPWIASSNAMRKLVYARRDVRGGGVGTRRPTVPDIPIPEEYCDTDSDWQDVCYLAFPMPEGALGDCAMPCAIETNGNVRVFHFEKSVTIRTLELPSPSQLNHAWSYNPDTHVLFEAQTESGWRPVCDVDYPQGCWQDKVPFSVACDDALSTTWRLTVTAPHTIKLPFARLHSAARLDNWEGKAGHVLRGLLKRPAPRQDAAAYVPRNAVRVVRPGDVLVGRVVPNAPSVAGGGLGISRPTSWTVLRVGHVNMKKKNAPAPKEATGWECDKQDPRGIEANFSGYIGRLVDGPLAGGKLNGMIVDSWECERQTWTWRMPEWFREANGYDVNTILPAVFGWVLDSPAETERILLDWRRTISGLVTKNYYGRMAELAHGKGLSVAYETAFGDVVPGDILEYWKYCDTPMCEFWQPYALDMGGVGHPNFKPVRPCVSAAHIYGKRRVDCEAFTSMSLTWDENFRTLKEQAVRHFARGVTHLVFHTCTHNPQTDGRLPGTSFGSYIGTPFVRGQTWWPFMRAFTDWTAECCAFLERGKPVVDVLRYLGDDLDHKPDEREYFPDGFKNDYLNADVLFNRLEVRDGRFVLPDGMSYAAIWVPPSVMVMPKTRMRLGELAAKGGRVVYGIADDAVAEMKPQVLAAPSLLWYHRVDGDVDLFFVAADGNGFKGGVTFSTQHGNKTLALELAPFETRLINYSPAGFFFSTGLTGFTRLGEQDNPVNLVNPVKKNAPVSLDSWTLSFPQGWGAPERMKLDRLVPWKDLPGVSEEGRAFSGTATYTANISLPHSPLPDSTAIALATADPLILDLGDVRDFARVYVNGSEVAALWSEPYRCDIAPFVKKGVNEIRVKVTSTWFNRLAYDFAQPPEKRKTWTVWNVGGRTPPCLVPDAKLRPSGLLGPVRLLAP